MFMDAGDQLEVSGASKPLIVDVQLVNWDFFDILGVRPLLGRSFTPEEDQTPDARPVTILSYATWNAQFGADREILGKTVRINEQDYNVVGVMPKDFKQIGDIGSPSLWTPMMMYRQLVTDSRKDWLGLRRSGEVYAVGRLKPGVSLGQARVSMNALANRLAEEYPTENSGRGVQLLPLSETNIWPEQHSVYLLAGSLMMGIVGLVLLIACGNVANLLLTRATHRRREFAIRRALGASRGRLIRQLLTECFLLGLAAAALGIVCAYWARDLVWMLLPAGRPPNMDFSLDGRVLLFTLGISVVATLLFGLTPSLQASNARFVGALRNHRDTSDGVSSWYGLRGILVTAQVAFSLIALVGAALFIHSLRNARQVDPGFETKHELVVALNPRNQRYTQERGEQYYRDATEKVRALPMGADAGIANYPPFLLSLTFATFPEGVDTSDLRNSSSIPAIVVGPRYFSAAGIPLLRGRDVNDRDEANSDHVVVVNQALADYLWPGQNPMGKRLTLAARGWKAEVVGLVATVKARTLGEPPQPLMYIPLRQMYQPNAVLYVRTKGDPGAALSAVRNAVQSLDSNIQFGANTLPKLMSGIVTAPRVAAALLSGFGVLALLLAAIGTYGVMSYSVSQRTQEIGIRMALGAQRGDVLRLVLSKGMTLVAVGVVVGLGASVFFTRSINALLYGIGSFDAASFFAAAALLIAVELVACWVPARRAMRVDPIIALRCE